MKHAGWIVVLAIFFLFYNLISDNTFSDDELIVASHDAVRSYLQWNAEDAEFDDEQVFEREKLVEYMGDAADDSYYGVLGWVEASNGFGAQERVPFLVEFDEDGEVTHVSIDDKEY